MGLPFARKPFAGQVNTPKSIILTESLILHLGSKPDLCRKLPFICPKYQGQAPKKGCKCGQSTQRRALDKQWLNSAKVAILSSNGANLGVIKSALGVEQIVVYIQGPNGVEKKAI